MRNIIALFLLFVSGLAYSQQVQYMYPFTLDNGTVRHFNISSIRIIYERESGGATLVTAPPLQNYNVQESLSEISTGGCDNFISVKEEYTKYSQVTTRNALINPMFVEAIDSLRSGKASIRFYAPTVKFQSDSTYSYVSDLFSQCVTGGGASIVGSESITIQGDSAFLSQQGATNGQVV